MKRFLVILTIAVVLALSIVPAFAAEGETGTSAVPVTVNAPVSVTVEDNTPAVVYSTDAGSGVRSAFASAIVAIFGEYTPLTQTVTTYFADGSSVESVEYVPGLAGLDWVWIAGVVLFGITLYCIFRMIGGVLKWN